MNFGTLTTSDWIEIIGILASTVASLIAIVVSVKALKQNNAMLSASTRPYIVIYGIRMNCGTLKYGFVIKNFGKTAATITKFKCNCDLKEISYSDSNTPFEHIVGTMLAPEQSILSIVDRLKLFDENRTIIFEIEYIAGSQKYSESFVINCESEKDNIMSRTSTQGEEMRTISYTLQEIAERLL